MIYTFAYTSMTGGTVKRGMFLLSEVSGWKDIDLSGVGQVRQISFKGTSDLHTIGMEQWSAFDSAWTLYVNSLYAWLSPSPAIPAMYPPHFPTGPWPAGGGFPQNNSSAA